MPERRREKARAVHENLDTAYVNLAALLRYLQQREFEGRVHVELDEYEADVYVAGHNQLRTRERDHVTGREEESEAALHRLIVRASEAGGLISIFENVPGDGTAAAEAHVFAGAPESRAASAAGESEDESKRRHVLQLSQEVIAAVERAVVATTTGEDFANHFRDARVEIADDYPFLVSLSDCVEYAHGAALLARGMELNSFVAGVCEALRRVVEHVATNGDERGRGVRSEVTRELAALEERRPKALARFKFTPQLERIAGLRRT